MRQPHRGRLARKMKANERERVSWAMNETNHVHASCVCAFLVCACGPMHMRAFPCVCCKRSARVLASASRDVRALTRMLLEPQHPA